MKFLILLVVACLSTTTIFSQSQTITTDCPKGDFYLPDCDKPGHFKDCDTGYKKRPTVYKDGSAKCWCLKYLKDQKAKADAEKKAAKKRADAKKAAEKKAKLVPKAPESVTASPPPVDTASINAKARAKKGLQEFEDALARQRAEAKARADAEKLVVKEEPKEPDPVYKGDESQEQKSAYVVTPPPPVVEDTVTKYIRPMGAITLGITQSPLNSSFVAWPSVGAEGAYLLYPKLWAQGSVELSYLDKGFRVGDPDPDDCGCYPKDISSRFSLTVKPRLYYELSKKMGIFIGYTPPALNVSRLFSKQEEVPYFDKYSPENGLNLGLGFGSFNSFTRLELFANFDKFSTFGAKLVITKPVQKLKKI